MLHAAFVPVAAALASTGASPATTTPPPPDPGARVVKIARTFLHTPYVWGGESRRTGVDCSGLVVAVYRKLGIELPHQSDELWHSLHRVKRLRLGDILAFGSGGSSGHVGIFIGHGRFIHAVGAGKGVRIGYLHGAHRHRGFLGAVRPKLRLRAARQAGNAVEHAHSVLYSGQRIHDRDAQGGTAL
jgi:cell wall-associated NlpC family hydrolase